MYKGEVSLGNGCNGTIIAELRPVGSSILAENKELKEKIVGLEEQLNINKCHSNLLEEENRMLKRWIDEILGLVALADYHLKTVTLDCAKENGENDKLLDVMTKLP